MAFTSAQLKTEVSPVQDQVTDYFQSAASYWNDIYYDQRLQPTIYRDRQNVALRWIRKLHLPLSARILEIGCGAGFLSVTLARKGYWVDAMDSTPAMVELTRKHALRARVPHRVHVSLGDVHALSMPANTYDLVIALGVIPWLHSEVSALEEMKRIVKPGGFLFVTADNEVRLNRVLDPRSTPLLKPFRQTAKRVLNGFRAPVKEGTEFEPKRHYPSEIDRMLQQVDLQKVKGVAIGFGPFTIFGQQILPDRAGVWLHRKLQRLSLRGVAGLRLAGSHYMVLSKKGS